MTRAEHIQWVKDRALTELKPGSGGVIAAVGSMQSDLTKHPETRGIQPSS